MRKQLFLLLMTLLPMITMAYDAEIDGIYYNFNGTEATVTSGDNQYAGGIVIPSKVKFNNTDYNVTSIGDFAFHNSYNLISITIPNSVTSIEGNPFESCSGLESINVDEGNTSYASEDGVLFNKAKTILVRYPQAKNGAAYIIPNNVKTIGNSAFDDCTRLTSVTIPNSVTSIEGNPFESCSGLASINVDGGNTSYTSEDGVLFNKANTILVRYPQAKNGTAYIIPDNVTSIGVASFSGCSGLTSVTIPDNVTTIGNVAFSGCNGLTSITIPNSVTSIGEMAFSSCHGLTSITIPGSVKRIRYYTFASCLGLTSVTISNGVTRIDVGAFSDCDGLTSITIPNSVTSIEEAAFSGCDNLSTIVVEDGNTKYDSRNNCNAIIEKSSNRLIVGCMRTTIPNSVTNIGVWAFSGCSGLNTVTIPNSVSNIEMYAFYGCDGLTDVYCYAKNVPTTDSNAFGNTPINDVNLHVLGASIDTYKATTPWSNFKEILVCNDVDIEDQGIVAGNSAMMEIDVSNYDTNLVGFQMDLTLPEGVGIEKEGCALSSRITDDEQELKIGKLESGAYRITSTSLSLTPISGNDGTLLTLKLTAADGCIGGQATISNIIFSTAESEKVIMSDKTFDISILYNLTYKVDGQEYKDTTWVYGAAITPEAEPTKEGYTFGGWSEIPETMPNHDVEITGNFTINKYLLTYMVDGEIVKSDSIEFNTAIAPLEEPAKEGYTFSGWSEIPETMPAHDVTITGTFTINKYLLTYMVDGEVFKSDSIVYNTVLTPEAEPFKEGYTFSGWSEIPETMPAHDVTITGTFTINKYLLTYMVDGEIVKSDSIEFNTAITPLEEPTKEGYTFTGWSEIPETMPSRDVEITGNFYFYGDVNTDEEVDVVDVVDIARFVVATPSANFREKLADLNFDKTVNIADAVTLVNFIAGDQNFSRLMTPSDQYNYNYDQCQLLLLSNGSNALSLCLDGAADFTAFQFEVELPENTDITAMSINGQRMDDHEILYNKVEANRYRVAVLSLSNAIFKGNAGELLNISIDGLTTNEVSVQNIHFVTKNGTDITFDALALSGTVTGIANVRANEGNSVVYDLQGRKLSKTQRGVNIVDGKKVIVK